MNQKLESTFRDDFTVADKFGEKWILDTFKRAFKHWKNDLVFITELALVLNWKCWEHYDNDNFQLSKIYEKLWFEVDTWCLDNLKWEDKKYYLERTD